jgi:hypothetical protein
MSSLVVVVWESAGYKVAAATGLAVEFRAFRRGNSRAVVGALVHFWKGVVLRGACD